MAATEAPEHTPPLAPMASVDARNPPLAALRPGLQACERQWTPTLQPFPEALPWSPSPRAFGALEGFQKIGRFVAGEVPSLREGRKQARPVNAFPHGGRSPAPPRERHPFGALVLLLKVGFCSIANLSHLYRACRAISLKKFTFQC